MAGQVITNMFLVLPVFDKAFYVLSFVQKLLKNLITDKGGIGTIVLKANSQGPWAICFKTKQVGKNVVIFYPNLSLS